MATESVAKYVVDADDVERIRDFLLEGIKASSNLERLQDNVESAARNGWTASGLVKAGMVPVRGDFDVAAAADLIQCLGMLPAAGEA